MMPQSGVEIDILKYLVSTLQQPEILALLLTALAALIRNKFRVTIVCGVTHGATFNLPPADANQAGLALHTGSITVRNTGNAPAHKLEIYLRYAPREITIYPPTEHHKEVLPDGKFLIKVDFLRAGETINLELMNVNAPPPMVENIRIQDGSWKFVQLESHPVLTKLQLCVVFGLIIIGFYYFTKLLLQLIQLTYGVLMA